jgi:hypothetical protein
MRALSCLNLLLLLKFMVYSLEPRHFKLQRVNLSLELIDVGLSNDELLFEGVVF